MRPDASFISQPVRSLQTMLRTLAEHDNRYQSVVPDGVYSSQTANAVAKTGMSFTFSGTTSTAVT